MGRHEIEVLLDDSFAEPGDEGELLEIIGDSADELDSFEVSDVAIDGFFGVPGLLGNGGREMSLEIERNDLLLVSDGAREIMDVAACGQETA